MSDASETIEKWQAYRGIKPFHFWANKKKAKLVVDLLNLKVWLFPDGSRAKVSGRTVDYKIEEVPDSQEQELQEQINIESFLSDMRSSLI